MHLKKVILFSHRYPTRDHYPFDLAVFHQTPGIEFDSPVSFFTGENGTGKSTLLRALARRCGIHRWQAPEGTRFETNPYEEVLYRFLGVEWYDGVVPGSFFASEIFRNFARILDEWAAADPGILRYFGGKSLLTQSHGQSIMSFFRARFRVRGLYLLDEPETALSAKSQLTLLEVLREAAKTGHAQFVIATHSPLLLACPGATIHSFDASPVRKISYEETEAYRIYRSFMEDRQRYTGEASS